MKSAVNIWLLAIVAWGAPVMALLVWNTDSVWHYVALALYGVVMGGLTAAYIVSSRDR